ncbi:MAG TPA: hypothetical protein DCY74_07330, partial [Clostridiales bacterium]|nr:hypothetical protein [Clostridiales bacterium]
MKMKGIAVVAECNPFHIGHQYLVTGIKEKYPHHALVAIMSGNYVQRGDFAIADKYIRAKTLIEGGLDLVLELPFPFNVLSAEGFAFGGVSVAKRLG